jgi:thiol-disulfide isomerase/thioredoxin
MAKIKRLIIVVILFCYLPVLMAQNARIVFRTEENISVEIYKPVDGAYNSDIVSDRLNLETGRDTGCNVDVSDFGLVMCKYSDKQQYFVLLQENDTIYLDYTNNKDTIAPDYIKNRIEVSGKNAPATVFYNQYWAPKQFSFILKQFKQWADSGNINFPKIREAVGNMIQSNIESLDRMCVINRVDTKIKNILKTSLLLSCDEILLSRYVSTLGLRKDLSRSDSLIIQNEIDSIVSVMPPISKTILKYNTWHLYLSLYFKHCVYDRLDQESKRQLTDGYDYITFGSYAYYLTAPDFIRLPMLGSLTTMQLNSKFTEFDAEKMFTYLAEKYPDSEYVALLTPMVKEAKKEDSKKNVFYIEKEVGSIKELSGIDGIKGKYAYIDLWATWCGSCKMEFAHNDDLYELLDKYDNITSVYISIDDDSEATRWREYVELVKLQGFNLRISDESSLYNEIYKSVYEKGHFIIPRYLLLNPDGEIIEKNLPGPSDTHNLKIVLDKYLKNKGLV